MLQSIKRATMPQSTVNQCSAIAPSIPSVPSKSTTTATSKPSLGTEIICSRDGGLAGGSSSAVSRLSPPQGGIVAHGLDCDHIDVPFQPFCADTSPTPPSSRFTTYSL